MSTLLCARAASAHSPLRFSENLPARAHRNIVHSFELSRLFQAHIPTYPSGHWLFGFSSRGVHPVRDLNPDWWNSLGLETRYYNTNLHKGAFYLPNYVQKLLEKVEE